MYNNWKYRYQKCSSVMYTISLTRNKRRGLYIRYRDDVELMTNVKKSLRFSRSILSSVWTHKTILFQTSEEKFLTGHISHLTPLSDNVQPRSPPIASPRPAPARPRQRVRRVDQHISGRAVAFGWAETKTAPSLPLHGVSV